VTEQEKSPLEQALDLLLYAPVGLALTAREELPKLIEKGRQRVSGQVAMARMMGEFAVREGQKEAGKAVKQAASTLQDLGVIPGPPAEEPDPVIVVEAEAVEAVEKPARRPSAATNGRSNGAVPKPSADGLAIPGYDALSASQVVQRLAGLAPSELEAVRDYEAATRGRRTILSRVAQLQAGPA
jgi:hypothetical protein